MQKIPFLDLPGQHEPLRAELDAAISKVVDKCDFIGGSAVREFEQAFAEYCGTRYCVGVSNGTDAIFLALHALGIGPGDEVITVPNTFIGTTAPILRTGATIRFVDCHPDTMNIDVSKIEAAITHRTRAIVPVHLYGQPADMAAIQSIARQHELIVVEDAAQAHGARLREKPVGSFGQAACFSFYPGKNLGAFGDAGAVVTDDEKIAARIRSLRDAGRSSKYEHVEDGYNHRLDTLQAAVLGVKLRHLPEWNRQRRRVAALYNELFHEQENITTVTEPPGYEGVYHLFVVQVPERDRVQQQLAEAGIATGIHYPLPLHLQPVYRDMQLAEGSFPVTEAAAKRLLSLPIFPGMTDEMVEYVADELIKAVS